MVGHIARSTSLRITSVTLTLWSDGGGVLAAICREGFAHVVALAELAFLVQADIALSPSCGSMSSLLAADGFCAHALASQFNQ